MARTATVAYSSGSERVSTLSHPARITRAPLSMSAPVIVVVHSVVKPPSSHSTAIAEAIRSGHMAIASGALARVSGAVGSPAAPGQATMKNGDGSVQLAPVTVTVTEPSSAGTAGGSNVMEGGWSSAAAGDAHSIPISAMTPASTSNLLSFIVRLSRCDTPTRGDHSAPRISGPEVRETIPHFPRRRLRPANRLGPPHSRSSCLPSLAPVNRRRNVRGMFSKPSCTSTR